MMLGFFSSFASLVASWFLILSMLADKKMTNINNQQSTTNSQQPTVNSQQPTVNNQQSTTNSQQLTAIVLAGGKSSRMGTDKALIPIQDVPMLQLVCTAAADCANKIYVVTPWQEHYQHLILPKTEFVREVPLPGETVNQGPLVGFAQGLVHVTTEWVLLLACDMPKLRGAVLREWVNELDGVNDEVIALLPRNDFCWEPLCGFYRSSCLTGLMEFINKGGRSFQKWLELCRVGVLIVKDREMLVDCDTPFILNRQVAKDAKKEES
jgi:molybdenum cofactor guanylyltransferase